MEVVAFHARIIRGIRKMRPRAKERTSSPNEGKQSVKILCFCLIVPRKDEKLIIRKISRFHRHGVYASVGRTAEKAEGLVVILWNIACFYRTEPLTAVKGIKML